jgi:hypothetical protein
MAYDLDHFRRLFLEEAADRSRYGPPSLAPRPALTT